MTSLLHLHLPHPVLGWLTLAVLLQAASIGTYVLVVRGVLRVGGVDTAVAPLVRATLGGIAMTASFPGGAAASAAYWYRQLRAAGADRSETAFALAASMIAGVVSLAALLVCGVALAGGDGPFGSARVPLLAGCAAAVVAAWTLRGRLARFVPNGYSLDARGVRTIGVLAVGNWLLECACLVAALEATHASVAPQGILVTYALSQLVASIPFLPGGGGTVEATLVVTFTAFGHTSGSVLAGVLLFRVLSCWGLVPIGWLAVALERPLRRLTYSSVVEATG